MDFYAQRNASCPLHKCTSDVLDICFGSRRIRDGFLTVVGGWVAYHDVIASTSEASKVGFSSQILWFVRVFNDFQVDGASSSLSINVQILILLGI